jgi:hypothetical protein
MTGLNKSTGITSPLFGEHPEVAGNRYSRGNLLDHPGGVHLIHIPEPPVNAGQQYVDPPFE